MKDYTNAINDYTKAIQLDSAFTDAYVNRGFSYYNSFDSPKRIKRLGECNQAETFA